MSLRELREAQGWSTYDLAKESGVSRSMVTLIETGDRQPSLTVIRLLATALELTASELVAVLEGEGDD